MKVTKERFADLKAAAKVRILNPSEREEWLEGMDERGIDLLPPFVP